MDMKRHWETVYLNNPSAEVSWFQPSAARSLDLISRVGSDFTIPIIDVGGGASVLVDDLLHASYSNITVLDLSGAAIATARARLGADATRVQWLEADVLTVLLPRATYGIWHDRALFHFLIGEVDRAAYVAQVRHAVRPGGYALMSTFAADGPTQCSGLEVSRYSPASLLQEFGAGFDLVAAAEDDHVTPSGARQAFIYCLFRWNGGAKSSAFGD